MFIINDEYLVRLTRKFNRQAFDILLDRYVRYSWGYLKKNLSNIEMTVPSDDLASISYQAFYKVIANYSHDNGYFYMYWKTVYNSAAFNMFRKYTSGEYAIYGNALRFDQAVFHDDSEHKTLLDFVAASPNSNRAQMFNRTFSLMTDSTKYKFTAKARKVFLLSYLGYRPFEISNKLGYSLREIKRIMNSFKDANLMQHIPNFDRMNVGGYL